MNVDEIRQNSKLLQENYPEDLTSSLDSEIMDPKNIFNATFTEIADLVLGLLNIFTNYS